MRKRRERRVIRHYRFREGDTVAPDANLRSRLHAEWDPESGLLHVFTIEWERERDG